jgi:hypothetical protein
VGVHIVLRLLTVVLEVVELHTQWVQVSGSTATQPTQPGNSGAYGFGNPWWWIVHHIGPASPGQEVVVAQVPLEANGNLGQQLQESGGDGGIGRAYTIADGTTPVYYAGGGGGGGGNTTSGVGGQGGGGTGGTGSPGAPLC